MFTQKNSLLVLLLFLLNGCGNTPKDTSTLTIGLNSGFPPYEIINNQGELEGFDIDLAKEIGKIMGKKVEFQDQSFDGLILSLKQGTIDAIISGMEITPTRKNEIAMVHYLGEPLTYFPIVFWQEIPANIANILDLKNLENPTICVQAGNIQEEFIKKYDFITLKYVNDISQLVMEVKYGKSLAFVSEPAVVKALQKQQPELKMLNIPLDANQHSFGNGIGIAKKNTKLIQDITNAITTLKNNDTIKHLEQKWFGGKHGN